MGFFCLFVCLFIQEQTVKSQGSDLFFYFQTVKCLWYLVMVWPPSLLNLVSTDPVLASANDYFCYVFLISIILFTKVCYKNVSVILGLISCLKIIYKFQADVFHKLENSLESKVKPRNAQYLHMKHSDRDFCISYCGKLSVHMIFDIHVHKNVLKSKLTSSSWNLHNAYLSG